MHPAPIPTQQSTVKTESERCADFQGPQADAFVSLSLMNRVGRVLQTLCSAREITDDEIKQHIRDCTFLMESAYDRFQATSNPADREEALLWMHRRDEAIRSLSPAYKAAREAQILQQVADGIGYFIDQGDAARVRLAGGRG